MHSLLFIPLLCRWSFNVRQLQQENLLQEQVSAAAQVQRDGVIQHGVERARVQQHRHITASKPNLRRGTRGVGTRACCSAIVSCRPKFCANSRRLVLQKKKNLLSSMLCWYGTTLLYKWAMISNMILGSSSGNLLSLVFCQYIFKVWTMENQWQVF